MKHVEIIFHFEQQKHDTAAVSQHKEHGSSSSKQRRRRRRRKENEERIQPRNLSLASGLDIFCVNLASGLDIFRVFSWENQGKRVEFLLPSGQPLCEQVWNEKHAIVGLIYRWAPA